MKKQESLTVKEALAGGYINCTTSDGDPVLLSIKEAFKAEISNHSLPFMILEKEQTPFELAENDIFDLIVDHLQNQDEVFDEENSMVNEIATHVNFTDITAKVNKALSTVLFYRPSNIILIP